MSLRHAFLDSVFSPVHAVVNPNAAITIEAFHWLTPAFRPVVMVA
jgi:hypothetical protein